MWLMLSSLVQFLCLIVFIISLKRDVNCNQVAAEILTEFPENVRWKKIHINVYFLSTTSITIWFRGVINTWWKTWWKYGIYVYFRNATDLMFSSAAICHFFSVYITVLRFICSFHFTLSHLVFINFSNSAKRTNFLWYSCVSTPHDGNTLLHLLHLLYLCLWLRSTFSSSLSVRLFWLLRLPDVPSWFKVLLFHCNPLLP